MGSARESHLKQEGPRRKVSPGLFTRYPPADRPEVHPRSRQQASRLDLRVAVGHRRGSRCRRNRGNGWMQALKVAGQQRGISHHCQ